MNIARQLILWLAFLLAGFLPASALTPSAPENPVWEIFSNGYDAASPEATIGYDNPVRPTSAYDAASIHGAAIEPKPTGAERPLK